MSIGFKEDLYIHIYIRSSLKPIDMGVPRQAGEPAVN